jgi:hypothetical protein
MQKAMLVFTEKDDAGNVAVSLQFDPPLMGDEKVTPAIRLAFDALKFIQRQGRESTGEEE